MDVVLSASLGILFLVLGFATVFLMFHLWGYPFDKVKKLSAAPPSLMRLHRVLGYLFLLLYIAMMIEMVPRMWNYQVEWPARTVAHMMFGMSIGIVLLIKLSILRFFRHFEEWMPVLGTLLLGFTIVLCSLSMPHAFREMALASASTGGDAFSDENRARVAKLLPAAGLPEEAPIGELATIDALRAGRMVLLRKCVVCHDLKTILTRPRSPSDWVNTVERMAIKPAFTAPISDLEQWQASAYLIAISRELQRSARERRQEDLGKQVAQQAARMHLPGHRHPAAQGHRVTHQAPGHAQCQREPVPGAGLRGAQRPTQAVPDGGGLLETGVAHGRCCAGFRR